MKLIILEATAEEIRSNRTLGEIITETLAQCFCGIRNDDPDPEDKEEEKNEE